MDVPLSPVGNSNAPRIPWQRGHVSPRPPQRGHGSVAGSGDDSQPYGGAVAGTAAAAAVAGSLCQATGSPQPRPQTNWWGSRKARNSTAI